MFTGLTSTLMVADIFVCEALSVRSLFAQRGWIRCQRPLITGLMHTRLALNCLWLLWYEINQVVRGGLHDTCFQPSGSPLSCVRVHLNMLKQLEELGAKKLSRSAALRVCQRCSAPRYAAGFISRLIGLEFSRLMNLFRLTESLPAATVMRGPHTNTPRALICRRHTGCL